MANVTIRQMRYFVALAEQGTYNKAADKCHISQPAMSVQMAMLEKEYGKLFSKISLSSYHKKTTILTSAGQHLLPIFKEILSKVDNIQKKIYTDEKYNNFLQSKTNAINAARLAYKKELKIILNNSAREKLRAEDIDILIQTAWKQEK